jgi:hypothetical protein
VTLRTPGVDIGRVEVLPAFNPELFANEPGDAPGAVTLMVIPRYDPVQPDAPAPDRLFLNAISQHIDARRLLTTEVFLRGPVYKGIWVSIGINVVAGLGIAQVREEVKRAILRFLAPLSPQGEPAPEPQTASGSTLTRAEAERGWPLRKAVTDRELLAEANRVPGVLSVNDVLVAEGARDAESQIRMSGLELPRVLGISVTIGEPMSLDELRGTTGAAPGGGGGTAPGTGTPDVFLPVPVIPEEC